VQHDADQNRHSAERASETHPVILRTGEAPSRRIQDPPSDEIESLTPAAYPHWIRTITIFLTGQTLSIFGSAVVAYAVIWWVVLTTGSGWKYALIIIAAQLSQALTTLPGGILADRFHRKTLLIGSDIFVTCWTIILAIFLLRGFESFWLIAAILCLRGLAGGVRLPAEGAVIPQLVPENKLIRINSINATLVGLNYIAAPAVAALLLAALPLGLILFVDVITTVIGVGCILAVTIPRVKSRIEAPTKITGYATQMLDAGRYVMAIPQLKRLAIIMVVMFIVVLGPANMGPVMVVRFFGDEKWMLAAIEMVWSVGMIAGGGIMAIWGGPKNRMTLALAVTGMWGIFSIGLGLSPNIWVFLVVMAVFGLTLPGFNIVSMTSVQERVPEHLLGRTMGLINFIMALAIPLGMVIVGPLADVINLRVLAVVCGVIGMIFIGAVSLDRGPASRLYAPESSDGD
jgi:DHA3 family macrolide efflux protein-like MFS transporter